MALIDRCNPLKRDCFPYRRYNECLAGCSVEKACVEKRAAEAREELRKNPPKGKSK